MRRIKYKKTLRCVKYKRIRCKILGYKYKGIKKNIKSYIKAWNGSTWKQMDGKEM